MQWDMGFSFGHTRVNNPQLIDAAIHKDELRSLSTLLRYLQHTPSKEMWLLPLSHCPGQGDLSVRIPGPRGVQDWPPSSGCWAG